MLMSKNRLLAIVKDMDDPNMYEMNFGNHYFEYTAKNDMDVYIRRYYYPEEIDKNHIRSHMLMDAKVSNLIHTDVLLDFLTNEIDKNALSVCECIAFIWDEEDNISTTRQKLADDFGDEYALYACEDTLGLTWTERQIILINVGLIYQINNEIIYNDETDLLLGILSTIFHEFRHLLYECHELLELGPDSYPYDGGEEIAVEDYGNSHAEKTYVRYTNLLIHP